MVAGTADLVARHCFATGIRASVKHLSVIDKLCDQARRQSTVVVCFYLDRASQEEQSPTDVLGSLLKQLVNGLDKIPGEVLDVFREEKMGVGGRALRFSQIEKLFQTITSSQRTIICVDGLHHCRVRDRLKLLNSLREILQKSPGTQLFLTGKPDIRGEIETELGGAATAVPITTTKDDVISYLRARLNEDPAPDAMDSILKADILNRITKNVSSVLGLVASKIDETLRGATIFDRRLRLNAMTENNLGPDRKRTPRKRRPPIVEDVLLKFLRPDIPEDFRSRPAQGLSGESYYTCLTSMPQGDQPVTDLQIEELYPDQPTHHHSDQDSESHRPSPGGIVCTCGWRFQRPVALERHLRTSKKHSVDNFKAHFRRQHKKSNAEADNVIRDWRSQQTL